LPKLGTINSEFDPRGRYDAGHEGGRPVRGRAPSIDISHSMRARRRFDIH